MISIFLWHIGCTHHKPYHMLVLYNATQALQVRRSWQLQWFKLSQKQVQLSSWPAQVHNFQMAVFKHCACPDWMHWVDALSRCRCGVSFNVHSQSGLFASQQERRHSRSLRDLMQTFQALIALWDREMQLFWGCLFYCVDQKRLGTSIWEFYLVEIFQLLVPVYVDHPAWH